MPILIQYHTRPEGLDTRSLGALTRQVALEALRAGKAAEDAEVSIVFMDDEEMRALNAQYRNIPRPTDVLAFALTEGSNRHTPPQMLGDVVISLQTAARQADRLGHSLRHEIAVLLVHGILHLLGYDHEKVSQKKENEMRAAEHACLDSLQKKLVV